MRNKILFILAIAGMIIGLIAAFIQGVERPAQPPVFQPASNPYAKGIYANGIIESYQSSGENINIYPEVSGTISKILVAEGDTVLQGDPLLTLDETIPKAAAEQQKFQAAAALSQLEALKAQPRKEILEVARAQAELAGASLKNVQDQLDKQRKAYELDPKSVSRDALDNAENAVKVAKANLEVAQRQLELTKAGAWVHDLRNQENQYRALQGAAQASQALLAKYTLRAPVDGVILSVNAAVGSFISSQGTYATYTQGAAPVVVMGGSQPYLGVRCYIDEILIHRLPPPGQIQAQMSVRGTNLSLPLEFVRMQPYVSPKIELSNQRKERVDVRVLPVIFRLEKRADINLYPGQLVDVYIGEK